LPDSADASPAVYNLGVVRVEYALLPLRDAPADLSLLDDAERARAARFVHARSRSRFVQVRGALRRELAHRLRVAPGEVRFAYGAQGKPSLPGSDVTFSVAHSGNLALLAFAKGSAIGADLERVREVLHRREIASRLFDGHEPETLEGFFRLWVRHEARVKCAGGSALQRSSADAAQAIADVPTPPGYAAAICAAGSALTLIERPLYSAG
jgi:4'-phosphopantetheinyl transferase